MFNPLRPHRARLAVAGGVLGLIALVTALAPAANAAAPTHSSPKSGNPTGISAKYDVTGSSYIAKPDTNINLGPTSITVGLNDDNSIDATLPLPPTKVHFKAVGLLPTHATVSFTQVGKVKGKLLVSKAGNLTVTSTAHYTVGLSKVTIDGKPADVGANCQTREPITINVNTPHGQTFDLINGGTLAGAYTLGKFGHCNGFTGLTNLLVAGPNNTVTLQLSNGVISSS